MTKKVWVLYLRGELNKRRKAVVYILSNLRRVNPEGVVAWRQLDLAEANRCSQSSISEIMTRNLKPATEKMRLIDRSLFHLEKELTATPLLTISVEMLRDYLDMWKVGKVQPSLGATLKKLNDQAKPVAVEALKDKLEEGSQAEEAIEADAPCNCTGGHMHAKPRDSPTGPGISGELGGKQTTTTSEEGVGTPAPDMTKHEEPLQLESVEVPNIGLELLLAKTGPDKKDIVVAIFAICSFLGVLTQDQAAKLLRRTWGKKRLGQRPTRLPDGRFQPGVWLLDREGLMMWLAIINENKLDEDKRPGLIALQEKITVVLDKFSFDKEALKEELGGKDTTTLANNIIREQITVQNRQLVLKEEKELEHSKQGTLRAEQDKLQIELNLENAKTCNYLIQALAEKNVGAEYEPITEGPSAGCLRHRESGQVWVPANKWHRRLSGETNLIGRVQYWSPVRLEMANQLMRVTRGERKGKYTKKGKDEAQRWSNYRFPEHYFGYLVWLTLRDKYIELDNPNIRANDGRGDIKQRFYREQDYHIVHRAFTLWGDMGFPSFRLVTWLSRGARLPGHYPRLKHARTIMSFAKERMGYAVHTETHAAQRVAVFTRTVPEPGVEVKEEEVEDESGEQ